MTKLELLEGYKQLGLTLSVVNEEHTELGDIFYVRPTAKVSVKSLKASEEDVKIVLGVKELVVTPDYASKSIKIAVTNPNPANLYASAEGVVVENNSLRVPIGASVTGTVYHSFGELPHLLIAGSTGSGKSRFLHQILTRILEHNEHVSIVPIDFKGTELTMYAKFVTPIFGKGYGTSLNDAYAILSNAVYLMNHRYVEFKGLGVADISEYNKQHDTKLDHIFIVVDELADLMLAYTTDKGEKNRLASVKSFLVQLAQKARSAGIHLILSTQRPTVDVLSGHIKANIVSRVALKTSTAMESKIILDEAGAEGLVRGGFIYKDFDTLTAGRSFSVDMDEIRNKIDGITYAVPAEYEEIREAKMQDVYAEAANRPVYGGVSLKALVLNSLADGEKSVHDIATEMTTLVGWDYNNAQYEVRKAAVHLESEKLVNCTRDIGAKANVITEDYLRGWRVRKVETSAPRTISAQESAVNGAVEMVNGFSLTKKTHLIKEQMFK